MEETKIKVKVSGTRPLLQNNFFENDNGGGAAKKGQVYDDQIEAEKRLIKNKQGLICQPSTHFEASMVKSATDFKFSGKKTYKELFKAGIFVDPLLIPHDSQEWVIDRQLVVINRARIMRARPRFEEWSMSFEISIRDDRIQPLIVKQILENAGKYYGVGDYRPRFGLFVVDEFQVIEQDQELAA